MERKISAFSDGAPLQASDLLVIARSGQNYKIAISDALSLHSISKTITAAEMQAMTGTAGKELVAAQASHAYLPLFWLVQKSAGTAFTLNSATSIMVGHNGLFGYVGINSSGLLDQTTKTTKYRHGAVIGSSGDDISVYNNVALHAMVNATPGLTGGSTVNVQVVYFDIIVP